MDIKHSYIEVKKTARYASYGTLSEKTRCFWFVLHGSNMLCEQMIYKFSEFDPETHFVIAPEGLSRFYKDGFQGDVTAAWMTKRDRLKEIHDFSFYLTALYNNYVNQIPLQAAKVVLGFSQGGTTAYRWLHNTLVDLDFLIGYSCWIPEDINFGLSQTKLNEIKKIYTYGDEDRFLNKERINAVEKIMRSQKLAHSISVFKGKHRIEKQQLDNLYSNYIKG